MLPFGHRLRRLLRLGGCCGSSSNMLAKSADGRSRRATKPLQSVRYDVTKLEAVCYRLLPYNYWVKRAAHES